MRLDVISIEFINNFGGSYYPTFLHYIVEHDAVFSNDNCNKWICINKIFTTLHETNKLTRELLSIRNSHGDTLLMRCCFKGLIKPTQIILSLDECDEDILLMQNSNGMNALMLALYSYIYYNNYHIKYVLLNSNKITKNILTQRNNTNKTIYDMLYIITDTYFRCKLNASYYFSL